MIASEDRFIPIESLEQDVAARSKRIPFWTTRTTSAPESIFSH